MNRTERLAVDLVPVAARLVAAVRDDGPADVAALLAAIPDGRHDALAVVLAAMVDPDRTPSELLAWTDWRTQQTPVEPPAAPAGGDTVDEIAVQQVLGGHRMRLTGATQHAAVHALTRAHLSATVIADRLLITPRHVVRLRGRTTPPKPRAVPTTRRSAA